MSIHEKVEALLQQMTLEEKIAQMVQVPYAQTGREESLRWAEMGAGSFLHVLGDNARQVQRTAMEKSRLGIPVIFGIDAIHGHGLNEHAAIFPTQLATACSWEPEYARIMGEDTAREVAADGLHWTFSPVLCLGRDTRWGRIDETFGEDPYLAGEMGAAIVKGYQGDDLTDDEHILACAKHYLAYGEATGGRDAVDSEVTERKVRQVFLPVFQRAVEAGCATFMTAYGSVDGVPLTANRRMMKEILRDELGFDGFVVTDWDNVNSLVTQQHTASDLADASRQAAEAGNDMIMTTLSFYEHALAAVRSGLLKESDIDEAVRHILTVKFRMDLFNKPQKHVPQSVIGCESHIRHTLDAARASITLLRNNGVLPVGNDVKTILLVGANADDIRAQYGDWTYFTHPLPKPDAVPQRPYVTLKEGLEALCAEQGIRLVYVRGCGPEISDTDDIEAAVSAAADADLIIAALGDTVQMHGEYRDRADLALSGRQAEMFDRLKALGKPVVTAMIASKPLCLGSAAESADAVITGFNGGMFGGQALAEAIFGRIEPQGRLPITYPRHSGQLPVHYMATPGWHGGKYVDLPETPLFAFGEGMGYTQFTYSDAAVDADSLTVTVDVTNAGSRAGTETVQVYVRDMVSSVLTPVKRLVAFSKVDLVPGEKKQVSITLKREDFSLVNARCQRVVEPGEFRVMVGHSSKDEDLLTTTITL